MLARCVLNAFSSHANGKRIAVALWVDLLVSSLGCGGCGVVNGLGDNSCSVGVLVVSGYAPE